MNDPLPTGAFLSIHYLDRPRDFHTWRVYYEDGRVDIFDGKAWWQPRRLTADQVAQVKQALRDCGLLTASDLSGEGIHDAAPITWHWRVEDRRGKLVNAAYPAKTHPAMECAMTLLLDLEDQTE